jgi:hypothetical protein
MVFLKNEEFDEGRFDTFVGQKDFPSNIGSG